MKLLRFDAGRGPEVGILAGEDEILSVKQYAPDAPADLAALIEAWDVWRPTLETLPSRAGRGELAERARVSEVQLLSPIGRPGKILGIGLNYADHVAESGMARPAEQLWFMKGVNTVAGPHDAIRLPKVTEQLDYEGELVVVIGRRCRYADAAEAAAAIFGFCVGNDVSVRDWQFKTSQFLLGKSFDGHAPYGPWITTADAVDAGGLSIVTKVNGEVRQSSNTAQLIFDPVAQVQYLSQVMTLEPGDLIYTGTPGGVGAGFNPPRWLKPGDRVEVEISGLGAISNAVVAD